MISNVEHYIITRDAYSVSWAEIWEFSKSQRDIIDAVTISKIIAFEIICNAAYYSAAKFTFPIEQSSNKATKYGIRRSWKLKVKPNHGCCSYIAITISYISVFCFIAIIPRLTEFWPFKCQGHPVSLWCWPLACNRKVLFIEIVFWHV